MIDQLSGIRCLSAAVARKANKEVDVLSCPDAIARALKEAMGAATVVSASPFRQTSEECGRPMRREATCAVCDYCGDSKCGVATHGLTGLGAGCHGENSRPWSARSGFRNPLALPDVEG